MKIPLLLLILALPLGAAEIRIQRKPTNLTTVSLEGQEYVSLAALASTLQEQGWTLPTALEPQEGLLQVQGRSLPVLERNGEVLVALVPFCEALGGRVTFPERTVFNLVPPETARPLKVNRADPATFYFSQIRSSTNAYSLGGNANCLPASLAMAALAFDRLPLGINADNRPALMQWCREALGVTPDDQTPVNIAAVPGAAEKLQLHPQKLYRFEDLEPAMKTGKMVLVAGDMADLGFPPGGHAMLVVGMQGKDFLLNDPGLFFRRPGTPLAPEKMRRFFKFGVALGN